MVRIKFKPLSNFEEEVVCIPIDKTGNLPMEYSWTKIKYPKFYLKYRQMCANNIESDILDMSNNIQDVITENIIASFIINDDNAINYEKVEEVLLYLRDTNKTIAIPYGFGCNLKNKGNWNKIYNMIMDIFSKYEKDVIIYKSILR